MTSNPYEPSSVGEPIRSASATDAAGDVGAPDGKLLVYAQLFLRLLGVMMFVDGLAVGGYALVYGTLMNRANGSDAPFFYEIGAASWLGNAAVYLAAGTYLMIGGNWIVEKILTPSARRRSQDDEN